MGKGLDWGTFVGFPQSKSVRGTCVVKKILRLEFSNPAIHPPEHPFAYLKKDKDFGELAKKNKIIYLKKDNADFARGKSVRGAGAAKSPAAPKNRF